MILDNRYLGIVQQAASRSLVPSAGFTGCAIATKNIAQSEVEWKVCDTVIHQEGIARDLGIYDSLDAFYAVHGVNMTPLKQLFFSKDIRHRLNARVERIRKGEVTLDLEAICATKNARVQ